MNTAQQQRTTKADRISFFIILLLCILPQAATDLYLPSLPAMAHYFSVNIDLAEWSIALYMIGMAISQLIYGPLSEGFGRKIPLIIGLSLSFIGCLICLFAENIEMLLLGRLIQGFGAGACSCLFRAMLRDLFKGDMLVKYTSYLIMIYSAVAPAAPVMGGYLQHFFSWRASFVVLLGYTGFTLLIVFFMLPESNVSAHRSKLKLSSLLDGFGQLIKSPLFLSYALLASMASGATYAWITSAPVILIKGSGLTPILFGWAMFLTILIPTVCAGWINPRMVKRFGVKKVLYFAWTMFMISGCLFILFYYIWPFSPVAIILPATLFLFSSMFVFPNAFSCAFASFGHIAGIAATVYAAIQMTGGAFFSAIFSHFSWVTPVPLGCALILLAILSYSIFVLGIDQDL